MLSDIESRTHNNLIKGCIIPQRWSSRNQRNLSDSRSHYADVWVVMGGFTQPHCNCDNVFRFLAFSVLQINRKIDCGQLRVAAEMCLASFLSINLSFLNSTFICIYNISRLSWVISVFCFFFAFSVTDKRVLVPKNNMLKQFLHIPAPSHSPAICQVSSPSFFLLLFYFKMT